MKLILKALWNQVSLIFSLTETICDMSYVTARARRTTQSYVHVFVSQQVPYDSHVNTVYTHSCFSSASSYDSSLCSERPLTKKTA